VAAQHAITRLRGAIAATPRDSLPDLDHLTQRLNETVRQLGLRISPEYGIGTTLTYALLRDAQLHLAHIGDSRCYLLRQKQLVCLTVDHTVENEVRARRAAGKTISLEESQRKALARCIGQQGLVDVDISQHPLQAGDRCLFCSDGIDKAIDETELAEMLDTGRDPGAILHARIALADERGGGDNATGVLVFVDDVP
jgi:protein phosphatase